MGRASAKPNLRFSLTEQYCIAFYASNTLPNGDLLIHSEVLGLDLRLIDGELRFYDPQTDKRLLSHKETEQARLQAEQARRDAIPRLLGLGLSVEQVADALGLSVEEVKIIKN